MIKKEYKIKGKNKYFEISDVIRQGWISKISVNHSNTRQEMQRKNTSETEVLLLVNPLIIKSLGSAYSMNDANQFKQVKSLDFGLESEKPVNPKLEKKNKKVVKNEETEAPKSKLKLKKKISSSDDDANTIKKQGGGSSKKNRKLSRKKAAGDESINEKPTEIFLSNPISVQELAEKIYVSETEIIRTLFLDGVIVNINQVLDIETAIKVGEKLDVTIIASEEEIVSNRNSFIVSDDQENTEQRPPIIAVMGHVDHGKTTLLDKIRQTQIAQKEAGGITQKIGAYEVEIDYRDGKKKLVFLDTPGHEAFSSMRSRGVQVTDIAVLVVAADDGVKPQTIETIKCIKEAEVPLIVAINKIDKDDANIDNIKQELSSYNVIPDDWGGDTPMIPISAKQGTNMNELLEMMVLVSEMLDLRASRSVNGQGTVLEANLDKSKGAIATLLVQNGVLNVGDIIVTSQHMAKIRGMVNSNGEAITESLPSSPALVWGLSDVPNIGDKFEAFKNEKEAKTALEIRKNESTNIQKTSSTSDKYSLLSSNIEAVINLVIKTDIQGSVEAIISSINQIDQEKVKIRVLYASPGEITETDVDFADASKSKILAFNSTLAPGAKKVARHLGVTIKEYNVIYDLFDDIQIMVDDIIGPQYEERSIGKAIVKAVFPLGKNYVAGSFVNEGKIVKGCHIKVNRDGVQVYEGILSSLKQFKQDVLEIEQDSECGIYIEEFDEWKEDDIILAFELIEKKKK
jgi:translation initiation factor IF-2